MNRKFDIIIIGGSYAGLSAAMSLGRALFRVLILDSGAACNRQTPQSHNFITQDGTPPAVIAASALDQVLKYPNVTFEKNRVTGLTGSNGNFQISTGTAEVIGAAKVLFATGIKDIMPDIDGFSDCWGISAIHCPFCHGYEYRHQKTGLLMNGEGTAEHAIFLSNWTDQLSIFSNGKSQISVSDQQLLLSRNIKVIEKPIQAIVHSQGHMKQLLFDDAELLEINALYVRLPFLQHSTIPEQIGCELNEAGFIKTDTFLQTNIEGIYAAGDNVSPMRSVSNAVAQGTFAGAAMSRAMILNQNNQ